VIGQAKVLFRVARDRYVALLRLWTAAPMEKASRMSAVEVTLKTPSLLRGSQVRLDRLQRCPAVPYGVGDLVKDRAAAGEPGGGTTVPTT